MGAGVSVGTGVLYLPLLVGVTSGVGVSNLIGVPITGGSVGFGGGVFVTTGVGGGTVSVGGNGDGVQDIGIVGVLVGNGMLVGAGVTVDGREQSSIVEPPLTRFPDHETVTCPVRFQLPFALLSPVTVSDAPSPVDALKFTVLG